MVVTKYVMQQPQISRDASMPSVAEFQYSIQRRPLESLCVLMMMIPGANTAFGNNRNQVVAQQRNNVINGEVEDEVQSCERQDE